MPPQKKGKEKAHPSAIEESERTHEQDLDLSPLSFISGPVNVPTRTQPDEGMEVDGSVVSGLADSILYPELDPRMDLADDAKTPQPIADVSKVYSPMQRRHMPQVRFNFCLLSHHLLQITLARTTRPARRL